MTYDFRRLLFYASATALATPIFAACADNVQSIRVTPQAKVEYAEVVTDLIESEKLKGLSAVGIRPAGQQYQLMGPIDSEGRQD